MFPLTLYTRISIIVYTVMKGVFDMAQSTTINIRVDEDVKREADAMLDKLGMNMSVLVNMTLRQLIMDEALPFLPRYKHSENMAARKNFVNAINEAHKQAIAGGLSEDASLDEVNSLISEARKA